MKAAYKILAVLIAGGMASLACLFHAGSVASAPAPATVGNPPPDLPAEADRHASLGEMKRIYATANEPKELWVIPEAPHADFHRFAPEEYERRVLGFLIPRLAS